MRHPRRRTDRAAVLAVRVQGSRPCSRRASARAAAPRLPGPAHRPGAPRGPGSAGSSVPNRYAFSALLSLEEDRPSDRQLSLDDLARTGIGDYLDQVAAETAEGLDLCVFVDQLEELFTLDPTDQDRKAEFLARAGPGAAGPRALGRAGDAGGLHRPAGSVPRVDPPPPRRPLPPRPARPGSRQGGHVPHRRGPGRAVRPGGRRRARRRPADRAGPPCRRRPPGARPLRGARTAAGGLPSAVGHAAPRRRRDRPPSCWRRSATSTTPSPRSTTSGSAPSARRPARRSGSCATGSTSGS